VPFAAAAWLAALFALVAGGRAAAWLCAALVAFAGAAWWAARRSAAPRGPARQLAVIALFAAGFAASAGLRAAAVETHPIAELAGAGPARIVAAVAEDPQEIRNSGAIVLKANLVQAQAGQTLVAGGGSVSILARGDAWLQLVPGERIALSGNIAPPDRNDLTIAVIQASSTPELLGQPPWYQRAASWLRQRFAAACEGRLSRDAAGLLPGLVDGDRSGQSPRVAEEFKAAGLSHLPAVSGANVSIVLGAVLALIRLVGVGPKTAAAVCAATLLAFVIVARPSPSVIRAAAMGSVGLLALVAGRSKQAFPALAAAVIALLAWQPRLAVDFGFALSVVATMALIAVAPVWAQWLERWGAPRAVAEALAVAFAACLATAPVVAAMTGTVSLVSVAANVLVAPAVPVVTLIGAAALAASALSPALASWLAWPSEWPLRWILWVAKRSASVPGAQLTIPPGWQGAALVTAVLLAASAAASLANRHRLKRSAQRSAQTPQNHTHEESRPE
jgi:competence protein ComEC